MNKLFKKIVTFALASCMCITTLSTTLFACSSNDGSTPGGEIDVEEILANISKSGNR